MGIVVILPFSSVVHMCLFCVSGDRTLGLVQIGTLLLSYVVRHGGTQR